MKSKRGEMKAGYGSQTEAQQEGGDTERETLLMGFNDRSWEEDGRGESKMDDGGEREEMNSEGKFHSLRHKHGFVNVLLTQQSFKSVYMNM